jgi:CubicO group peptidase (beta-lactamase class C family)
MNPTTPRTPSPRRNAAPLMGPAVALLLLLSACAQPGAGSARATLAPDQCGVSAKQLERVRHLNGEMVRRGYAPGAATLLLCEGRPMLDATDGMADARRPMQGDELYRIFSMTKPITALAVMMLVEDKRLALDDPLGKHLPAFAATPVFSAGDSPQNMRTVPVARPVTIRDLLSHSAGLGYPMGATDPVGRLYAVRGLDAIGNTQTKPTDGSPPIASGADFIQRLGAIPLMHQPGSKFNYGWSSDVLGQVIEKVSGQRLGEFFKQRIFGPLGMNDTFFVVPPEKIGRLTAAYVSRPQGHTPGMILHRYDIDKLERGSVFQIEDSQASQYAKPRYMEMGGAGLVSSATDYQRFLQLMVNRGMVNGRALVRAQTVAEMTRNQLGPQAIAASSLGPQGLGYGFGFATYADPGKTPMAVPPNGYFWGGAGSTFFWVDPDRRITGVVMTQVLVGDAMAFYLEMIDTLYAKAGS